MLLAKQDDGTTALMLSCGEDEVTTVHALLAAGASVNSARSDGSTALHAVAGSNQGNLAIAEALLSHGARVNVRTVGQL